MRRWIREARRRIGFLFRRNQAEADLCEEMQFHLESKAREMREQGIEAGEAERRAARAFGSTLRLRESGLEMWGWGWLDRLVQDVRWSVRSLRRTPAFTVAAVLTLALGIGANTAIFTVVRADLLRPLPYPQSDRLAWVFESSSKYRKGAPVAVTEVVVDAWRQQSHLLDGVAAFVTSRRVMTGVGDAEELAVGAVTPGLFRFLGASPWRGRLFTTAENSRGRDGVAVLSQTFWQRRFGADERAIGRQVMLGGRAFTVIGVLPSGFGFAPLDRPREAWFAPKDTDIWVPVSTESNGQSDSRYYLGVIARLRAGVVPAAAEAELSRIAASATNGRSAARVFGLQDELVKKIRTPLLLLAGAAFFVLLIVCANVAHLQLARGMARGREMAIRAAVGAGRGRLVRQLLVEASVLAMTGGLLGLLVAEASLGLLLWIAGNEIVSPGAVRVDGSVLAFTLIASVASALLFGLVPARQATHADLQGSLKQGGQGPVGQVRRTAAVLVVAEVSLALVLVTCAALMVNTVWHLRHAPAGFESDRLVTLCVKQPTLYGQPLRLGPQQRAAAFVDGFLPRIRALPGVEAAVAANTLPMGGAPDFAGFSIVGGEERADMPLRTAQYRVITPGYFNALRIPLRRGRAFTDDDRRETQPVAIVNETMERLYFGGDAIGRYLTQASSEPVQVVGVVGDVRHETLRSEPLPEVYHPFAQRGTASPWLAVRVAGDDLSTVSSIRKLLAGVEPGAAVTEIRTMNERRAESLGTSRFLVFLLAIFAGLALLLALIGSYGVVSYWVSRRRQEFGVRLALGAPASRVVWLVVGETTVLIAGAAVLGVAGAAACTRLLSGYLYQVTPTDPGTLAAAVAVVMVTGLSAAYVPARRAARTDPVVALRQE